MLPGYHKYENLPRRGQTGGFKVLLPTYPTAKFPKFCHCVSSNLGKYRTFFKFIKQLKMIFYITKNMCQAERYSFEESISGRKAQRRGNGACSSGPHPEAAQLSFSLCASGVL